MKAERGGCPIDRARPHSNSRVHLQRAVIPSPVMVLGGKTLLWCENGIVFLRPAQAPPVFPRRPRESGSLSRLRPRAPSALSEKDHLFTGRCDLVIPPLSRDLPRTPLSLSLFLDREKERRRGNRMKRRRLQPSISLGRESPRRNQEGAI